MPLRVPILVERFGVYVRGGGNAPDDRVRSLSALSRLSDADARQVLVSRIPRRASEHADRATAEAEAASLRTAGINAFVFGAQELAAHAPPEVRGAVLGDRELSFRPVGRFGPGELRVVVRGCIRSSFESRSEARLVDPTHRFVQVKAGSGQVRREESEPFLSLYGADLGAALELRARRFDFRCLGGALAATRTANLELFLEWLRTAFPAAVFDETLESYPLSSRDDESCSSDAHVMLGSIETRTKASSTEGAARRVSYLIAAFHLYGR